ncbi:MAG: hypothetical protein ABIJ50_04745 [Pseudomonadota bacterium]
MGNSINSSGFSGYKAGGSSGGGSYSPNATVITTGGSASAPPPLRPKNIINAISDIQQFYVIEKQGQEIPAEFLTLEGSLDFFKIGGKSGLNEGLLLILLLPIVEFYLMPFVLKSPGLLLKIMFGSIPYLPIIINTFLCAYVSRYFIGNITRKAINSLFSGRMIMLVVKSFLIYVFYTLLTGLSTPERVWLIAQHAKKNSEAIYTGYMTMLPHIMPIAIRCSLLVLMAAILPYGTVFFMDMWRRHKIKCNHARISGKF